MQWKRFFVALLVMASLCVGYQNAFPHEYKIHLMDYVLYLFRGEVAASLNADVPYVLPTISIIEWILISFIVGNFATRELLIQGENTLLRAKSRIFWWNQKCIWNIWMNIIYSVMIYVVIEMISAYRTKDVVIEFNWLYHQDLFLNDPDKKVATAAAIFLPIIASIAMTQMQMTISLFLGSQGSFIIMLSYFVCSAYIRNPWLIGNAFMLIRIQPFSEKGIPLFEMVLFSIGCWICAVAVGQIAFERYDVIRKIRE